MDRSVQNFRRIPKHWANKYRGGFKRYNDVEQMYPFMGMYNRRIGPAPNPFIYEMYTLAFHANTPIAFQMALFFGPMREYRIEDVLDPAHSCGARGMWGGQTEIIKNVIIREKNLGHTQWIAPIYRANIYLRSTGLLPDKIEVIRAKKARGAERRTRWFYAKVIQRHWRASRMNPYTKVGRNKISRDYEALLCGN